MSEETAYIRDSNKAKGLDGEVEGQLSKVGIAGLVLNGQWNHYLSHCSYC